MDATAARTFHIRRLVTSVGGPAEFARRYGSGRWSQAQVSQWISDANPKGIGRKLARTIEAELGLEPASMDRVPTDDTETGARHGSPHAGLPPGQIDLSVLRHADEVARFLEVTEGLSPEAVPRDSHLERLVECYNVAIADGGRMSTESMAELMRDAMRRGGQPGAQISGATGSKLPRMTGSK